MRILCLSDTHGYHEKFNIDETVDVVVHTGDFSNSYGKNNIYETEEFLSWFNSLNIKHKILVIDCRFRIDFQNINRRLFLKNQNNFISLVLNKFSINCNVIELADRCNMSPKTLTRKFKEHFNDTPYQWIIQQKNKNILSRLAQPNVNVQAISEEFGFSSSAHFISYCKRYLKQTPLVIHKEIRKKTV